MKKHNGENLEDEDFNFVGVRVSTEEDDTFKLLLKILQKQPKTVAKVELR